MIYIFISGYLIYIFILPLFVYLLCLFIMFIYYVFLFHNLFIYYVYLFHKAKLGYIDVESWFYIEWLVYRYNSTIVEIFILIDWISCLFIGVVLVISSIVIWYSVSYMSHDKTIVRFIILVMLFVRSMVLIVLIPRLFSVLFGWDILGLVSYCLFYLLSELFIIYQLFIIRGVDPMILEWLQIYQIV